MIVTTAMKSWIRMRLSLTCSLANGPRPRTVPQIAMAEAKEGDCRRTRRAEAESRPDDEREDGIGEAVCDPARCRTAENAERHDREATPPTSPPR